MPATSACGVDRVVDDVERRDRVPAPREAVCGVGDLEADAVGDAGLCGGRARPLDLRREDVEAGEGGPRELLREPDHGATGAAADVGPSDPALEPLAQLRQ